MKRQIRHGVFETNSSSMHSLVVMKKSEYFTSEELEREFKYCLRPDKNTEKEKCVWDIWNEDKLYFGRSPFKVLGTFREKWLYALASLVSEYNDAKYKELLDIAMKNVPNLKKVKLPMTEKYIPDKNDDSDYSKEYGKTEDELITFLEEKEKQWEMDDYIEYWKDSCGYWEYKVPCTGSVDEDILSEFLIKENITLEEFLMNKKYIVVVDGDEFCIYNNMKNANLINKEAIDHEYPKYE